MTELSIQDRDLVYNQTFLIPCHLQVDIEGKVVSAIPDFVALLNKRVTLKRAGNDVSVELSLEDQTETTVVVGSDRVRMIPVKSSNVKAVGYTRDSRALLVQFSDSYYRYEDVGPEKFVALMQGPSVGKYLASQIKGVHKYTKVDVKPV